LNRKVLLAGVIVVVPLLGVLFANLGRDPKTISSPLVGRAAPPFTLRPVGGGAPISLESLRGRPVVVNFWATWCGPCFEEHPVLSAAARSLGSDVHFIGIVYQDEETWVQSFLREHGGGYPSLMDADGKTAIAYGIFGVPETYFIDPEGRVTAKFVGPLSPELLAENLRKARAPVRAASGGPW
jgi:cytochrome c biogenesis protein CcmG, thiol:disulfide interchange protein DsbE